MQLKNVIHWVPFFNAIQKVNLYNIVCNGHDTMSLTGSMTAAPLVLEIEHVSLLLELDSVSCDVAKSLAELL